MGLWARQGGRAVRRAILDIDLWMRAFVVCVIDVVSMAVLARTVGLARDTNGPDWLATGKLAVTEMPIGTGFDESVKTEYRTSGREILTLTREDLTYSGDAVAARIYLFRAAARAPKLGAWWGVDGALP